MRLNYVIHVGIFPWINVRHGYNQVVSTYTPCHILYETSTQIRYFHCATLPIILLECRTGIKWLNNGTLEGQPSSVKGAWSTPSLHAIHFKWHHKPFWLCESEIIMQNGLENSVDLVLNKNQSFTSWPQKLCVTKKRWYIANDGQLT